MAGFVLGSDSPASSEEDFQKILLIGFVKALYRTDVDAATKV